MTKTLKNSVLAALTAAAAMSTAMVMTLPAMSQEAWSAENFDLEALIEAARQEEPITIYELTGKVVTMAEKFSKLYGVQATGVNMNESTQVDLLIRESQAGNIVGDVSVSASASGVAAQVLPLGIFESWVPPLAAATIPANKQDPLVIIEDPRLWVYNTEVYDSCPISNIWELTDEAWNRRVALQDPVGKPNFTDFFNQLETHHDEAVAKAYFDHYGKELETEERSATAAWVKAFAQNAPLVTDSDPPVAQAVGAKGQTEPFLGLLTPARFRDAGPDGLQLGLCSGVAPFTGWLTPGYGLVSTTTKSPNLARLYIHYITTEEGISDQTIDGKISGNSAVPINPGEPSGIAAVVGELMQYNSSTAADDFESRQDWQDLWMINYSR
jgi:iron(III) transport system substrate-binding protein